MQFMTSEHQYISRKDEGDRIVVFEKGDLVFVFNFHWTNSYSAYRVGCLKPGKYKVWSSIFSLISSELVCMFVLYSFSHFLCWQLNSAKV